MDVIASLERRDQPRILGKVSDAPQFDLVVVRNEKLVPLSRNEGLAKGTAHLGPNGNVVQIWCIGAQTACSSNGLVERRSNSITWTDLGQQTLAIGGAELLDLSVVEPHRLTGSVLVWREARLFSPFINTYAAIFLIGGAIASAWRFRKDETARHRFIGNCYIALGALLPGIGGAATRAGYTEVLYVMELIGIVLIWIGYTYNVRPGARGAPALAETAVS